MSEFWHTPRRGDRVVSDIDPRHVGTVIAIVPRSSGRYCDEPLMIATVEWPIGTEEGIPLSWLRVVREDDSD